MTEKPTVYIVDDDRAVRTSLNRLLVSRGYRVEAYESAMAFLDAVDRDRPGCLILDVRMPEFSGIRLQELLSREGFDLPIIFVTGHGNVPMAVRALKHGAIDFIEKPYRLAPLLERIDEAFAAGTTMRKVSDARRQARDRLARLTPREREVFDLLTDSGPSSNKEVARTLGISPRTVEVHRARIMRKLDAASLADLTETAAHDHAVSPGTTPENLADDV